jgi:hypothetical protein
MPYVGAPINMAVLLYLRLRLLLSKFPTTDHPHKFLLVQKEPKNYGYGVSLPRSFSSFSEPPNPSDYRSPAGRFSAGFLSK